MLIVIVAALWATFLLTTAAVAIALPPAPEDDGGGGKALAVTVWAVVGAAASALWVRADLAPAALLPLTVWYVVSGVFILRGLRATRARRRAVRRAEQEPPAAERWEGTW